ncbi:hypothetical protein DFH07DRAFT_991781 [Mycena maculata]|uniref:Uncharacterized protein n=1 Tax=Mycena maculata TaxID=230809 RepID=A0AAD7MUQ1_9AGAR|nr:hypothetical protein DFH07DRAFT_991781 [Mycena maculata]
MPLPLLFLSFPTSPVGPDANIFNPQDWGDGTNAITLEVMRVILSMGLLAIGVELPRSYMAQHLRSLLILVIPTMTFGWLVVAGPNAFYDVCVHGLTSETGGEYAVKNVPLDLRQIIAAESAANGRLAYPFLSIAIYLAVENSSPSRTAIGEWLFVRWLRMLTAFKRSQRILSDVSDKVILGIAIGAVLGLAFSSGMKFSDSRGYISPATHCHETVHFNEVTENQVSSSVIEFVLNGACFVMEIGAYLRRTADPVLFLHRYYAHEFFAMFVIGTMDRIDRQFFSIFALSIDRWLDAKRFACRFRHPPEIRAKIRLLFKNGVPIDALIDEFGGVRSTIAKVIENGYSTPDNEDKDLKRALRDPNFRGRLDHLKSGRNVKQEPGPAGGMENPIIIRSESPPPRALPAAPTPGNADIPPQEQDDFLLAFLTNISMNELYFPLKNIGIDKNGLYRMARYEEDRLDAFMAKLGKLVEMSPFTQLTLSEEIRRLAND